MRSLRNIALEKLEEGVQVRAVLGQRHLVHPIVVLGIHVDTDQLCGVAGARSLVSAEVGVADGSLKAIALRCSLVVLQLLVSLYHMSFFLCF